MDHSAADVAAIARIEAVPKILEVVCRTTGMGFAAVARVTDERWIACAVRDEIAFGLQPGGELKLETTICSEIRESGRLVAIDHVSEDAAFCGHPTPAMYGFESYISVPITRPDGRFFGTLCAIDPKPAQVNTPTTIGMFTLFAELIASHLDAQERLASSERALTDERQQAELRDQFIAVLGHDLRNPLAATRTAAKLLLASEPGERAARLATIIQNSATRMTGLVDNVMDFAQSRLGGGMALNRVDGNVRPMVEHVITELQTAWPQRVIDSAIDVPLPVLADRHRVAQLFSNLLANALTHGDPSRPITVRAFTDDAHFELSVSNPGAPIPPEMLGRLFQPFARAAARQGQEGLGLGLYIASQIARAHGGTLDVTSSPGQTRFTFRMPRQAR
jgi:signal transduction histidine kinase